MVLKSVRETVQRGSQGKQGQVLCSNLLERSKRRITLNNITAREEDMGYSSKAYWQVQEKWASQAIVESWNQLKSVRSDTHKQFQDHLAVIGIIGEGAWLPQIGRQEHC